MSLPFKYSAIDAPQHLQRSFPVWTFFSDVFLSVEEITVSWSIPSEIACIAPVPLKAQDKNNEIISRIPFMTSSCANIGNFRQVSWKRIAHKNISRQNAAKNLKEKLQSLENQTIAISFRARDETRTHTGVTPLAPETSASTIPPPALQKRSKDTTILGNAKCPLYLNQ